MEERHVRVLSPEVARKIAAGEVIDRPCAIVRELMDNAVDSGATSIRVELTGGGIERIRVADDGCGMTKEDLASCARPHATSKIQSETDLLSLSTLGFRGEALASMAAVSRLSVQSGGWRMEASVTQDHVLSQTAMTGGTIVQTEALFENFPARRVFLKRAASEGALCRTTFEEKVLPRPDIAFSLYMDGEERLSLPAGQTLVERFTEALSLPEDGRLFYEIAGADPSGDWSFRLVIGEPSVSRPNRKHLYVYTNGRRIQEFALLQAVEYGSQGYFPNGQHPVACLFVTMNPSLVDFNIHPAKREARFKDLSPLHHAVSSATASFFRKYTEKTMVPPDKSAEETATALWETDAEETAWEAASPVTGGTHGKPGNVIPAAGGKLRAGIAAPVRHGALHGYAPEGTGKRFPLGESRRDTISELAAKAAGQVPESFRPNYVPKAEDEGTSFHFVGCALGTFLVAEKDGTLYIIDQHAAHERILYDAIVGKAGEKQTLLVPYRIQALSGADDAYLSQMQELLSRWGFEGRRTGDGGWEFTTVPVRWKGSEEDLRHDLLDRRIHPKDMINAVAASTACRSAVMDGTVLDEETAARIARMALLLPDPHCPHGRPVFTAITREQLFSLVKRT